MRFSNETVPVLATNKAKHVDCNAFEMTDKIWVRDPFILPFDGRYYLYHTAGERGIAAWVSEDLKHWSEEVLVFETPADFHGVGDWFWAPECHWFNGFFYLFTSVRDGDGHRRVSTYRATNPLGPFEDIAGGCVTVKEWDTIDGTLTVDDEGNPWLTFVHEWTSMEDKIGTMVTARLSDDFSHLISEPTTLFKASDMPGATFGVTDGPFLYRMKDGSFAMIWSNFGTTGYVVTTAYAPALTGPWTQGDYLFTRKPEAPEGTDYHFDGGHGMIFKTFDGRTLVSFHGPNGDIPGMVPHLQLFELVEESGTIKLGKRIH